MDGTQFLLQIFRTRLTTALEECDQIVNAVQSKYLRVLLDRAVQTCQQAVERSFDDLDEDESGDGTRDAISVNMSEFDAFPCETVLQAVLTAMDSLETAIRLT